MSLFSTFCVCLLFATSTARYYTRYGGGYRNSYSYGRYDPRYPYQYRYGAYRRNLNGVSSGSTTGVSVTGPTTAGAGGEKTYIKVAANKICDASALIPTMDECNTAATQLGLPAVYSQRTVSRWPCGCVLITRSNGIKHLFFNDFTSRAHPLGRSSTEAEPICIEESTATAPSFSCPSGTYKVEGDYCHCHSYPYNSAYRPSDDSFCMETTEDWETTEDALYGRRLMDTGISSEDWETTEDAAGCPTNCANAIAELSCDDLFNLHPIEMLGGDNKCGNVLTISDNIASCMNRMDLNSMCNQLE